MAVKSFSTQHEIAVLHASLTGGLLLAGGPDLADCVATDTDSRFLLLHLYQQQLVLS